MYKETCCENTSRNSQNFLNNRNWPYSVPTLVSSKNIGKGQLFITLDEEGLDEMSLEVMIHPTWEGGSVETLRSVPVLDVKVCYHQGRYGVEIMIESLFRDRTISRVRTDVETKSHSHWQFHRNLAKPLKIYPGIIVRQHLTVLRQMVLLRERYAGLKKGRLLYSCNQVWIGRIPWNVTAICETYKISCLMGKHLMKSDSANHSIQ